jgi:putative SOS response-associated peptidase YedK
LSARKDTSETGRHADAFYEWKVIEGGEQPYAIAREDSQPMAFADLWESFRWPDETVSCGGCAHGCFKNRK